MPKSFHKAWDKFQLPLPFTRVRIVLRRALRPGHIPEETGLDDAAMQRAMADPGTAYARTCGKSAHARNFLQYWPRPWGDALGFGPVGRAGDNLGNLLWLALPKRRRTMATDAVARHLGVPYAEARRIARASFSSNCRSFLELLLARRADWHFMTERLEYADPDNLAAASVDPEPAVMATAHLGSWELMAGALQLVHHRQHKGIVIRTTKDEALNRLILRLRTRPGVQIIEHRNASRPTLEILRQGGSVAFLVDHNCRRSEAVFLPFLGETAAVNMGPALLAVRAKAAIWPVFMMRASEGRYRLHMGEPLRTSTLKGSIQERVRQAAAFYTRAVEEQIRSYPEQWFWMHRRWKTRPGQENR